MSRHGIGTVLTFSVVMLADCVYRLYPGIIGGIFFDEAWMECEVNNLTARVYRSLSDLTKEKHPGAYTVLNSGESIPKCFEERLCFDPGAHVIGAELIVVQCRYLGHI